MDKDVTIDYDQPHDKNDFGNFKQK